MKPLRILALSALLPVIPGGLTGCAPDMEAVEEGSGETATQGLTSQGGASPDHPMRDPSGAEYR